MIIIKYIPDFITSARLIGAVILLLTVPFSPAFYIIYSICILSDILDGYIARKINAESKVGQILDSVSDILLILAAAAKLLPVIKMEIWAVYAIIITATLRILSFCIGLVKFHAFACLHTYLNKAAGAALCLIPFFCQAFEPNIILIPAAFLALVSAAEELLINIAAKDLNRNIKSAAEFFR